MVIVYLTQKELARRWRLSVRTLENWRYNGTGPEFCKFDRRVIYRMQIIEQYEREHIISRSTLLKSSADVRPTAGVAIHRNDKISD